MYINKLKRSMVLPTERDQRDMSMRRHKLFSFFSLNFFFFFFEDLFCLRLRQTNVWIARQKTFSLYNLFKILIRNSNWNQLSVWIRLFYFSFPETKTERHSLLYFFGFCFILCLNFKIATSRISSCCAWIQIAQHFVVGARELRWARESDADWWVDVETRSV